MKSRVLLLRHAQVALSWRGRCYGQTDVGLSREGRHQAIKIATDISRQTIQREARAVIVHSGLRRAAFLAEAIAELSGVEPEIDERWQERDFGAWEGKTWQSIWRETGNAMEGMLTDAKGFRPGGGETTSELIRRSLDGWRALPPAPTVIVVTHGGPIACVRAKLHGAKPQALADYRIAEGTSVWLERSLPRRTKAKAARL